MKARSAGAALLLLLLAGTAGPARAAEYRRITVNDGRVLVAAVENTTATGLELSMPQGRTTVRFDQVQSLEEVDQATWAAQPSWTVVVLPPSAADAALIATLDQQLRQAVAEVPAIVATTPDKMSRLTTSQRTAFAACGTDAACIQGFLDATGARVAVSARLDGPADDRSLVVVTSFAAAPLARREVSVDWLPDASAMAGPLRQTVETAMHLQPRPVERVLPRSAEPATATATTTPPVETTSPAQPLAEPRAATASRGPSDAALRAMSWVPLPGLPSAARGDWGGFGASWAVVAPGSVAMVAVAGQASFTRPQMLAAGIGGFYVLTVAANKAIGLRGIDAQLSAAPLRGGGAVIGLSGSLGARRPVAD